MRLTLNVPSLLGIICCVTRAVAPWPGVIETFNGWTGSQFAPVTVTVSPGFAVWVETLTVTFCATVKVLVEMPMVFVLEIAHT